MVSFGSIFGVVSLAGQMGSATGLFFTGWALDVSGGYTVPFRVLAAVDLVGAALIALARLPARDRTAAARVDTAPSRP